jgi:hypothetical protein
LTVVNEIVEEKVQEVKKESKVHKSLAEILGIPKRGDVKEQPKVAVVIDPKIAKVLRPHQIEGVKVCVPLLVQVDASFFTALRQERFTPMRMGVSWQTKWV